MNHDTPLAEVARHLPREAAAHLLEFSPEVQTAVLIHTRSIVVFWDSQRHITLDPIVYEGLLNGLVPSLAPAYAELLRLRHTNAVLTVQLARDSAMIACLREALADPTTQPRVCSPEWGTSDSENSGGIE